jgi:hypothetical protein
MNDIKVGQIWEHDSGDYSIKILEIDDPEVRIEYSDGEGIDWIDLVDVHDNYYLPEEEHHVITVDDAEAAYKTAVVDPEPYKPNQGVSVEDAFQAALMAKPSLDELAYAAEAKAMQTGSDSDIDKAEASYRQSVDSPLARVKRISYNTKMADLLVLGII